MYAKSNLIKRRQNMGKNINKLVTLAIGISGMSGSVIPAFADDEVQNVATVTNV